MRQFTIIAILLACASSAWAQELYVNGQPLNEAAGKYIIVEVLMNAGGKFVARIDYGKLPGETPKKNIKGLHDQNGERLKFGSIAGVISTIARGGWRIIYNDPYHPIYTPMDDSLYFIFERLPAAGQP